MRIILITILALSLPLAGCQQGVRQTADSKHSPECSISLKRDELRVGDFIYIEFMCSPTPEPPAASVGSRLTLGQGKIQFLQRTEVLHEVPMGPISSVRMVGGGYTFSQGIPIDDSVFTYAPGHFVVRAVSRQWQSNEVNFVVTR